MCVTPNNIILENGRSVETACHKCWQCERNRINDYVGRSIAESRYSSTTLTVTLTYGGGDHPNAFVLTYSDVQKFMKGLRNDGYKVRYIVAGEYGSKKARAHWHIVLFFQGKSPLVTEDMLEKRIQWEYWDDGYSFIEKTSYAALRYILKYVMKDQNGNTSVGHLSMSKKPCLGDGYFRELAKEHVKAGLVPASYEYSFDDDLDAKGKRRTYWIQGKSRENYAKYFLEEWWKRFDRPPNDSDLIEEYEDKLAAKREYTEQEEWDGWYRAMKEKSVDWEPNWQPFELTVENGKNGQPYNNKNYCIVKNELGTWYSVKVDNEGNKAWRQEIRTRAQMREALKRVT